MNEHIVIVSGAAPLSDDVVARIPDAAIVLAADGGLDVARDAGLRPSGLIGDLDSVSADGLEWAEANATIARHPADKDTTDTELALAFAADMNPARITLVGGGDRLDHGIGAIGALGAAHLTHVPMIEAWWNDQHVDVVHGPERCSLHLEPGSTLSVLALHGRVRGLSLDGVRWPLDAHDLDALVGHGISNEVLDPATDQTDGEPPAGEVRVELSTGVVTIFDVPRYEPGGVPTPTPTPDTEETR